MYNIKFKAYNNKKLIHIHRQIDTACWIWNHCIALNKRYYKLYKKYINSNKLQKHISKLRRKNPDWKLLNSQSVQEVCQRIDVAYQRFFKKKSVHPPKFKKREHFKSFVLKQSGWKIEGNCLTINKIKYKFSKCRDYENIKRISVKRDSLGDVYFILCCDIEPKKFKRLGDANIGLDFGLKTFITTSDNYKIESPLFLKQNLNKLKQLSKNFSKKKKGSNNRYKSKLELSRLHKAIANQREDFEWKLAHELCKHNQFIAIEDLDLESMKKRWGRKVSDLSYHSFISKLEQVSIKYGTVVQKVGRYFASSKMCNCNYKNNLLTLSDREWVCPNCGQVHDRDVLAANNILSEGIRLYRTKCKTSLEVTLV